ncbi:MAG TPA: type II toxin-antitoxin system death-on-curing family toxin [Verrucomicrobiae bacterium]|jgi:death-on-curing protein|nr:type II toxin-antitoxin system death-on-curing family toxin [Verrucomicrobiae bacterium]
MKAPVWIEERDALAIHERLLGLHGGAAGLRDRGLLESALARPRQYHAYASAGQRDIIAMAALYAAGIIRNHPFLDGNKRTGFVVSVLFLELNGYQFTASEEESVHAVIALAAGTLDEDGFAAFLRAHVKVRRTRS